MADLPISSLPPSTPLFSDEVASAQGGISVKLTRMRSLASPNLQITMSGTPFSTGSIGFHLNVSAAVTMTTFDSTEFNQTIIEDGTMWPIEVTPTAANIAPGTGVTLEWFDGTAVVTGARVIAAGSGAVLRKVSNTLYRLTGNGIS